MTFELYRSGLISREWRWRLRARNGRIVATGEGYRHRVDAFNAIELIRVEAPQAIIKGEPR